MHTILLAGGFAKRMWPLTKEQPKHLLDVGGKPMLAYVLEKLERFDKDNKIFISTNAKFQKNFEDFLAGYETNLDLELFIEDTHSEGQKLGSIGALNLLVDTMKIDDELLIIGADNLFAFEITDLYGFFQEKGADVIAVYDLGSKERASLYGIVDTDETDLIKDFLEKPEEPPTTLAATACYLFTRETTNSLRTYIDEGNNPDAMGFFITWLHKKKNVYAFAFGGEWFDIGSFESLDEANAFYERKLPQSPD